MKCLLHELLDNDFDIEVVSLYDCDQHSPEFLNKNPNHKLLALENTLENGGHRIMLESGAIVDILSCLTAYQPRSTKPKMSNVVYPYCVNYSKPYAPRTWEIFPYGLSQRSK